MKGDFCSKGSINRLVHLFWPLASPGTICQVDSGGTFSNWRFSCNFTQSLTPSRAHTSRGGSTLKPSARTTTAANVARKRPTLVDGHSIVIPARVWRKIGMVARKWNESPEAWLRSGIAASIEGDRGQEPAALAAQQKRMEGGAR